VKRIQVTSHDYRIPYGPRRFAVADHRRIVRFMKAQVAIAMPKATAFAADLFTRAISGRNNERTMKAAWPPVCKNSGRIP